MSRAQLAALEAEVIATRQELEASSPCASGFARHDLFLSVDECDLLGGPWLYALVGLDCVALCCTAHALFMQAHRSSSRSRKAQWIQQLGCAVLTTAAAFAVALFSAMAGSIKSTLSISLFTVGFLLAMDSVRTVVVDTYVSSCLIVRYALQAERALQLLRYAKVFMTTVQLTCSALMTRALMLVAQRPIGSAPQAKELALGVLGVLVSAAAAIALLLCCARLASTAAAELAVTEENEGLRQEIHAVRYNAARAALLTAAVAVMCALGAFVPAVRQQAGAGFAGVVFVGSICALWLMRRDKGGKIAPLLSSNGAPMKLERKVSESEALATRKIALHANRREMSDTSTSTFTRRLSRAMVQLSAINEAPVHERGVSLRFLLHFAQQKKIGRRATTAEVCERKIKVRLSA